ncbi:MAG: hypothetical protein ACFFA2_07475 [Promethearchaeota archaeon]
MAISNNLLEDKIQLIGTASSSDMGFVSEILKKNDIIITGIESPSSKAHGENEFVRIRDIKTLIKELIVFLCEEL